MNEAERIDYLIKTLEGDNAKRFADKTGIRTDTLSRARNGIIRPSILYTKILNTYPSVSSWWLASGEGEPFYEDKEKGEIIKRLERIEREIRNLSDAMSALAGVIDNMKNR